MGTEDRQIFFLFAHQGNYYAVPVTYVSEIIQRDTLGTFQSRLSGCMGTVTHCGKLLPVLDPTAIAGGVPDSVTDSADTLVIVQYNDVLWGMALDRYLNVLPLEGYIVKDQKPAAVESIRAYNDNALVVFSVEALSRDVKEVFDDQRLLADGAPAADIPGDSSTVTTATSSHLCVRLEKLTLAFPLDKVLEVIEGLDVTPLYCVAPALRGLINLRGQVLACVDLSCRIWF